MEPSPISTPVFRHVVTTDSVAPPAGPVPPCRPWSWFWSGPPSSRWARPAPPPAPLSPSRSCHLWPWAPGGEGIKAWWEDTVRWWCRIRLLRCSCGSFTFCSSATSLSLSSMMTRHRPFCRLMDSSRSWGMTTSEASDHPRATSSNFSCVILFSLSSVSSLKREHCTKKVKRTQESSARSPWQEPSSTSLCRLHPAPSCATSCWHLLQLRCRSPTCPFLSGGCESSECQSTNRNRKVTIEFGRKSGTNKSRYLF